MVYCAIFIVVYYLLITNKFVEFLSVFWRIVIDIPYVYIAAIGSCTCGFHVLLTLVYVLMRAGTV